LTNRLAWLDLFRGVSALMIVLFHYHDYLGLGGFQFGFLAVDGFFVLSGIVLSLRYTEAIAEGLPLRTFAAARLMRLYPMTVIAGLFVVLLDVAHAPPNPYMWPGTNGVWTIFLLFVPTVGGLTVSTDAAFPPDIPLWSLWAELLANAVWFAVMRIGRRWMRWLGIAAMLVLVAFAWSFGTMDHGWENSISMRIFTLARALAWFSVGYMIARAKVRPVASPAVLALALAAVFVVFSSGLQMAWSIQLATVALAAALLHALLDAPEPGPAVRTAAKALGLASFPLYLVHTPAGRLMAIFGDRVPHVVVLLAVLVPIVVVATWLNERAIGALHRRWRIAPHDGSSRAQEA